MARWELVWALLVQGAPFLAWGFGHVFFLPSRVFDCDLEPQFFAVVCRALAEAVAEAVADFGSLLVLCFDFDRVPVDICLSVAPGQPSDCLASKLAARCGCQYLEQNL